MWKFAQGVLLLGFAGLGLHSMFYTGFSPASWGLASLCIWGAVLTLRGWRRMELWEQRLFLWSIFSIGSFAHFIGGDPTFQDWSSVYYFCGPQYQYCTSTFRWNLRGWRKAIALWNFCLSTALAVQRLAIEAGLGGLLPGEEAVTRESFVSIAWRLIPFWLNRWESSFGAECSSILFELPHFALELLVVLPLVQILAGRLRVVGHPHLRAAPARRERAGGLARNQEQAPALAPNVLRCAWVNDSSQLRLLPRLRAHSRAMGAITLVTMLAAFNALAVPLSLERQAYAASRSAGLFAFEPELTAVVEAGDRAEQALLQRRRGLFTDSPEEEINILEAIPCIAADNCTLPGAERLITVLSTKEERPAMSIKSIVELLASGGKIGPPPPTEHPSGLLIPVQWAVQLLQDEGTASLDEDRLSTLLFRAPSSTTGHSTTRSTSTNAPPATAPQPASPPELSLNSLTEALSSDIASFLKNGMERLDEKVQSLSSNTRPAPPPTVFQQIRDSYLAKVASSHGIKSSTPSPHTVLPRLYRNLHKHVGELRRMQDDEHQTLVPLVEAALAIMRLSCERWFALVGVYLGYLLFRDPPPAARAVIRVVARISRIFQRAILLSFPGVCWIYGAGFLFSSFASVIFWAGPVLRGLEHLRSATAAVMPRDWHDATSGEVERMGGVCAICWGELDTVHDIGVGAAARNASAVALNESQIRNSDGGRAATTAAGHHPAVAMPAVGAVGAPGVGRAGALHGDEGIEGLEGEAGGMRGAGLPCGHAYHRRCLLNWLQSCYGQGRTATCPMCQTEIHLRVRYRMPTSGPAQGHEEGEGDNGGGANGGAGPHRREPGIPGLDALVDDLPDEFRHRFEPPIGPLALEEEHEPHGAVPVGNHQLVPPMPGGVPPGHAHAHAHAPQAVPEDREGHGADRDGAAVAPAAPLGAGIRLEGDLNRGVQGDRQRLRGPGLLNRLFHRGARPPR